MILSEVKPMHRQNVLNQMKDDYKTSTIQVILGHANGGVTMNLYVHVTGDEKVKEVEGIESALKIV